MWVLLLYEPEWFLSAFGGGAILKRIPTLLALPLLVVIFQRASRRAVYLPFALFVLLHIPLLPFVHNRGLAMGNFKNLYHLFFVFVATAAVVDSPARVVTLLKLFLVSFLWYGVQGIPDGKVQWHSLINNEDSYGPLMVMSTAFGYFFALGAASFRWRLVAIATAVLGVVGLVASFARGAVVAGAVVLVATWLRSPRKLLTLLGACAATGVLLAAVEVIFPSGAFWAEMQTITEGNKEGTGYTRWLLWQFGLRMVKTRPILGLGSAQFGPTAYYEIPDDPSRKEFYSADRLYNMTLHNTHLQVLVEEGIIGAVLWGVMIVDFLRRLRRLRTPDAVAWWKRETEGFLDIRMISLGLELSMVGFLVSALFYNQLYIHWFWTLICLAFTLSLVNEGAGGPAETHPGPRAGPARVPAGA